MKALTLSFVLLVLHANQIQRKPNYHSKNSITKHNRQVILIKHKNTIDKLNIGDTCYITTNNVPIRAQPALTGLSVTHLRQNAKVTVREILSNKWILIDYYEQDVGIVGYVLQQYLAHRRMD